MSAPFGSTGVTLAVDECMDGLGAMLPLAADFCAGGIGDGTGAGIGVGAEFGPDFGAGAAAVCVAGVGVGCGVGCGGIGTAGESLNLVGVVGIAGRL